MRRKEVLATLDNDAVYEWASRAITCFQLVVELTDLETKRQKFREGEDHYCQALDHASLGGNPSEVLKEVMDTVLIHKFKAELALKNI